VPELRHIRPGDRVEVDHKGRKTWATVVEVDRAKRTVSIEPDETWFTWLTVPAKEVVDHIAKAWRPQMAVYR
jgi:hypothetical protein